MSETGRARAGIGIPSFLMIVTTLLLTVFGVFSINDARADAALQQRHEVLSAAYYDATAQVQYTLAQLDEMLVQAFMNSEDEAEYAQRCAKIRRLGDTKLTWLDEKCAVFYADAGYGRQLHVEIERSAFDTAIQARFTVTMQILEDTGASEEEIALPLIARMQHRCGEWA